MADPRDVRDQQVEAILRRAAVRPSPSSPHVEGEQLAAWAARSLRSDEAARVEAHLAECVDCQAMLAAFVESEPAGGAVTRPAESPWRLRWLLPLVATSAAVLVWAVVVRDPAETTDAVSTIARVESPREAESALFPSSPDARGSSVSPSADAVRNAGPAAAAAGALARDQREAAPAQPADALSQLRSDMQERQEVAAAPRALETAKATEGEPARSRLAAEPPPVPQRVAAADEVSAEALAEARALSPAAPAAAARTAGAPAAASAPAGRSTAAPATAAPAPPAEPGQRTFEAEALGRQSGNMLMDATAPMAATAGLPVHARASGAGMPAAFAPPPTGRAGAQLLRWRVTADGRVERSTDGGNQWQPVDLGQPTFVTAGSAPASSVCWLVGRDGVVLRSTNGADFERRAFPVPALLAAVEAVNATAAAVTTADGRVFRTTDGGVSWQPAEP